jgi:hypothetical protein
MRYTPITEQEANDTGSKFQPIPDGDYPFEVLESTEKVSKAGNAYIAMKLGVVAGPNREQWVWANLVPSPSMQFQVRHFCESTGLLPKYSSGQLSARDCLGRTGMVRIKTEKQEGYDPRNVADDYIVKLRDVAEPSTAQQTSGPVDIPSVAEDDIAF